MPGMVKEVAMVIPARAPVVADRRWGPGQTGGATFQPTSKEKWPLIGSIPVRLTGRTLALTAEKSRSEPWPGNQVSESGGAVAALTASAPDHQPGIEPRS